MKRILAVFLILALCLSFAVAASADTNIDVDVNAGGDANVEVNVGGPPATVIVNGVTVKPPKPPVDPDQAAREARNRSVKDEARDTFEYLESELERIGWSHGYYKIIRSYEVRVIYGSKGSNKSSERAPIRFYYEDDPTIEVSCYMVTLYGRGYCPVLFTTNFRTGKHADEYSDKWLLNKRGQDGVEAVDTFIAYLESLVEDPK